MPVPTDIALANPHFQRGSPTPRFEVEKPRRRSPSPMSNSLLSSSTTMYSPPPLTWRTAFQDAKAGIHYTKDAFPTSTFLPPPFSREPVQVEAGDRVEILDEIDDYAVRVHVLRTGVVGLIPLWNTEGALERLTRINTAFNEAATCPVEARAMRRRDSASSSNSPDDSDNSVSPTGETSHSLSHVHARCIPFATRVRFPDYYGASSPFSDRDEDEDEGDNSSDSDGSPLPSPSLPAPPHERGRSPYRTQPPRGHSHKHAQALTQPAVYEAQSRTLEQGGISETSARAHTGSGSGAGSSSGSSGSDPRRGGAKSVNFAAGERPQVVFRYPSEELVGAFLYEKQAVADSDESDVATRPDAADEEEDAEWWWRGWEEMREDEDDGQEDGDDGDDEIVLVMDKSGAGEASGSGSTRREMLTMMEDEEDMYPFVFYEDEDEDDDQQ
ncbi:hypothetical protein C8Q80DRAFT_415526 [Daedaleopsis nitida]|nr:hypothetical protein C8Q80DRAFT_415526 [Daedaleopsis nitida]